jgi:hypothetical protein
VPKPLTRRVAPLNLDLQMSFPAGELPVARYCDATTPFPEVGLIRITAAALIALMVSTGAVSKFNLIELVTLSEIDRAYVALTTQ